MSCAPGASLQSTIALLLHDLYSSDILENSVRSLLWRGWYSQNVTWSSAIADGLHTISV